MRTGITSVEFLLKNLSNVIADHLRATAKLNKFRFFHFGEVIALRYDLNFNAFICIERLKQH